jgi:hypothetical protein
MYTVRARSLNQWKTCGFLCKNISAYFVVFFKGIDSRDLYICFWCHSVDLKFQYLINPFVCFLNFVFTSNFLIFAFQCNELTLWVVPLRGSKVRYFSSGFTVYRKIMRAKDILSPGLQESHKDTFHLQNFSAKTTFAWDPYWAPIVRG